MGWEKVFFEVDLTDVKTPDLDPNWQKTQHNYSRQQIDGWIRQLGEIQRLSVERGYTYDDFQRMRNSLAPLERELGQTHHKFYDHGPLMTVNKDFVSLTWNGKEYEIDINGNHRVYAAQEMGIRRMPAEVSVRSEQMEQLKRKVFVSNLMHPSDLADFSRSQDQNPQLPTRNTTISATRTPSRTDQPQPSKAQPERISR